VVILLHGFPADRSSWSGVIPPLAAAGFRVLAPDQRGYSPGARARRRRDYALQRLAGDVLALADQAGAQRFHVVGHDWGATVAWYLGAHHADRVRTLTSLSVPHPQAILAAMARSSQALRLRHMAFFQLPAVPEWLIGRPDFMRRSLIKTGLDPESAARYATRAGDMTGPLNWYRGMVFGGRMPAVRVPTQLIWSDRDRFLTRTAADRCADWVTGPFSCHVLRGVSHWIPEEAPERTAELILALT
jgi:pimeloyl-ACP methyl ester carboxylesterase